MSTAFQQIDANAYDDEKPLDAVLLKDIKGNLDHARQKRLRRATWAASLLTKPRLCAYRNTRYVPFFHYLTPGTTDLTVRILHEPSAQTVGGCTLGCGVVSRARAERPYATPEAQETTAISSSVSGKTVTSFDFDDTVIGPLSRVGGWVVIWVSWRSDIGSPVDILDAAGTPGSAPATLESFGPGYFVLNANGWVTGDDLLTSTIEVYDASASEVSFGPLQAIRSMELGADEVIFTWPMLGTTSGVAEAQGDYDPTPSTGDYARRRPLGYTDLLGIEVRETAAEPFGDMDAALDAGQPTSGRRVYQALYDRGERFLRQGVRTYHLGPSDSPGTTDSNLTGDPIDRISRSMPLTTNWQSLAACRIARGQEYTDSAGTVYERTSYRVLALVYLHHYEEGDVLSRAQKIDMRLLITDPDGTASDQTRTIYDHSADGTLFPSIPRRGYSNRPELSRLPAAHTGIHLWGYSPWNTAFINSTTAVDLAAHALRGTLSSSDWSDLHRGDGNATANWIEKRFVINRSNGGGNKDRVLGLQIRLADEADAAGRAEYNGGRWASLVSWTVIADPAPSLVDVEIGQS